jgi:hypothetical protein
MSLAKTSQEKRAAESGLCEYFNLILRAFGATKESFWLFSWTRKTFYSKQTVWSFLGLA